jgi:hypothetical protein
LDSLEGSLTRKAALFIAPYTQLVFGIEIAIRALRKQPFAPRGKYNVTICLAIIGMLTLVNFLVAAFDQARNFCLTSLFWFVSHWSLLCFALLVVISVVVLACTIIIFVRLYRSIKIEVTARVAASRMVYYLALAVITTVSHPQLLPGRFLHLLTFGRGLWCRSSS